MILLSVMFRAANKKCSSLLSKFTSLMAFLLANFYDSFLVPTFGEDPIGTESLRLVLLKLFLQSLTLPQKEAEKEKRKVLHASPLSTMILVFL